MKLEELCEQFKDQVVRQGYMFWRTDPPRDYMTGLLFNGINFLILGLNSSNRIDHRWISEGVRKSSGLNLRSDAKKEKVLIFTYGKPDFKKGFIKLDETIHMFSIDCWNITMIDGILPMASASTKSLTDILPLIKIPYKNKEGITYFNIRNKLTERASKNALALDPLTVLRELCNSFLPRIRTVTRDDPILGTQSASFDELTVEIASCRIAHTLGCKTPLDSHAVYIRKLIKQINLSDPEHQLMLARVFRDASVLEEQLLTEEEMQDEILLNYEIVNPLISVEEWDLLVNTETATAAKQLLLEKLMRACEDCKNSDTDDLAYIRYISDLNDEIQDPEAEITEFYATSLSKDGKINGILKTINGNLRISLSPEVLWANFTVEITHIPQQINL